MTERMQPLVSVVTPVYNGEAFLAECIESVVAQTYSNYEYIIVNNRSTDRTLEIAAAYAAKDSRIRVRTNKEFVGVIDNHNIAFSSISPDAKYCKVVSADDFLFPECLTQMVKCAENNPSVGIIGSYQLTGSYIKWQGFQYPRTVFPGREICRQFLSLHQMFVSGHPILGFGTPTSLLYRADLIRSSGGQFYPNQSPHADTSACFKYLKQCDFGFVYEVLCYERIHGETQTAQSKKVNRYLSATLNDVIEYGPLYLSQEELELKLKETVRAYHEFLAMNWTIGSRQPEFWKYHKARLRELGYPLNMPLLLRMGAMRTIREFLNPEQAIRKVWRRLAPRSRGVARTAA